MTEKYKHSGKETVTGYGKYQVDVGHINDPESQERAKSLAVVCFLGWRKALSIARETKRLISAKDKEYAVQTAAKIMCMVGGCDYHWSYVFLNRVLKTDVQPKDS